MVVPVFLMYFSLEAYDPKITSHHMIILIQNGGSPPSGDVIPDKPIIAHFRNQLVPAAVFKFLLAWRITVKYYFGDFYPS